MSFNPPYDKIQGYDDDAASTTVSPVRVAGKDGTGKARSILTAPDGTVKVDGSSATQPVSGTVTVQQGTASSLKVDLSGTSANATAVKVDGSAVTQPVSGTVTANLGTIGSAATAAKQDTGNTSLSSIDGKLVTAKTADYDTGAGTDTVQMHGIALPASGGAVAGGTSSNPVQVSLANTASNSTAVKVDGSGVTQPVSGTLGISANSSVNVNQVGGTAIDTNSGTKSAGTQRVVLATDQPQLTAALKVDGSGVTQPISAASLPLPSGAATSAKQPALGTAGSASADVITVQGIASMTAVKVDGSAVTQPVSGTITANPAAASSGGATPYHYLAAASSNQDSQNVKASAGNLYTIVATNTNASVRYLKIYDKASGPTSSDTPVQTYALPGNANGAGIVLPIAIGMAFSSGIGFRLTTGAADNDTGAVASNEIIVNLTYK